jgi:hypothetical protein
MKNRVENKINKNGLQLSFIKIGGFCLDLLNG